MVDVGTVLVKSMVPSAAVLVDGAHALGHIHVDLSELAGAGVDFWLGNGHKWLYSPKGSCVLWVYGTSINAPIHLLLDTNKPIEFVL